LLYFEVKKGGLAMIRNRLAALMGERGLKVTRVAKETGISRNTITSIFQNDSEMMRMDTINTLCKYLGVTPCEFFEYEHFDIDFFVEVNHVFYSMKERERDYFSTEKYILIDDIEAEIIIDIKNRLYTSSFELSCSLVNKGVEFSSIEEIVFLMNISFDNENEKNTFIELYDKINVSFHQEIFKNLKTTLEHEIKDFLVKKLSVDILFEDEQHKQRFEKGTRGNARIDIQSDVFKRF
jgi:DNA-binding Xre family transcriptional regulator